MAIYNKNTPYILLFSTDQERVAGDDSGGRKASHQRRAIIITRNSASSPSEIGMIDMPTREWMCHGCRYDLRKRLTSHLFSRGAFLLTFLS
jgi:hypothetical protein